MEFLTDYEGGWGVLCADRTDESKRAALQLAAYEIDGIMIHECTPESVETVMTAMYWVVFGQHSSDDEVFSEESERAGCSCEEPSWFCALIPGDVGAWWYDGLSIEDALEPVVVEED